MKLLICISQPTFGSPMPTRTWSDPNAKYKYGFNGIELEDGISGFYFTEFRELDSRIGRWISRDPIFKPYFSSYIMLSDMPIVKVDPRGDDDYFDINGNYLGSDDRTSNDIRIVTTAHVYMGIHFYKDPSKLLINTNSPDVKNAKLIQNYTFKTETDGEMMVKILNYYFNQNKLGNLDFLSGSSFSFINLKSDLSAKFKVNNGASKGNDIMNTSFISGYSSKPVITIPALKGKLRSEFENSKWNFINTMVHEYFHAKNHKNSASESTDEGIIQHLDAYKAQIDHSSWKMTTTNYKKYTRKNIQMYISKIKDDKKRNEQIARFKNR